MITLFLESPWPAVVIGVAALLVLLSMLMSTGQGKLLYYMGGVVAAVALLVLVERLVVTDREAIYDMLQATGKSIVAKDTPAVLANFSPSCPKLNEVKQALSQATVSEAKVAGDVDLKITSQASPRIAKVNFLGTFSLQEKGGMELEKQFARFILTMQQEGDRWVIMNYEMANIVGPGEK